MRKVAGHCGMSSKLTLMGNKTKRGEKVTTSRTLAYSDVCNAMAEVDSIEICQFKPIENYSKDARKSRLSR